MVDALINYLISKLLESMFSATGLTWQLDKTGQQTFKIFTTYEYLGIQDANIEIAIVADNSEKFSYSITNKVKYYTDETDRRMSNANEIAQKAKIAFDKFLDDNLYYHYINYSPVEYSTGFNPVAPTIVFGPFISAGSEMDKETVNHLSLQFKFIKDSLANNTIVYKRTTRKRKGVENIDNMLTNTEEI